MGNKTAMQVQRQIDVKANMVAHYVASIMVDINQKTPLSYEQADSISKVLASPVAVLVDEVAELQQQIEALKLDKSMLIDRLTLVPTKEMTPDYFVVGKKILVWNGYFFEAEWDGDDWCSIGGDDFDFFMPLPSEPLQKGTSK